MLSYVLQRPMLLFFVLLALLSSLFLRSAAHFMDPTVAAFPIAPQTSGESHTVHLPSPSPLSCTFTHSTAAERVNASLQHARFNMAEWLSSMTDRGECGVTTSNYWEYEVCALAGVRQFKQGESYSLGKERTVHEMNVVYSGGDQCVTQSFNGPRETTISLACDLTATALRLTSISEPSTCHYAITVSTAAVCGDSRFPQASAGSAADSASEDWYLEIAALHAHDSHSALSSAPPSAHGVEAMCVVYSLEPRARKSELNFAQWELRIDRADDSEDVEVEDGGWGAEESGHGGRDVEAPLYVVRHPGRRIMADDEYEVELSEHSHVIRSSDGFNGQLAYAKLYA